jgi:hypothetical protein
MMEDKDISRKSSKAIWKNNTLTFSANGINKLVYRWMNVYNAWTSRYAHDLSRGPDAQALVRF